MLSETGKVYLIGHTKAVWDVPICQNTWQEGGNYELLKNFIGFIQIKKEY